jgi:hypothetical protein
VVKTPSLYERGWRQGSLLNTTVPYETVGVDSHGELERRPDEHGLWLVVTQDCDLDRLDHDAQQSEVELRPVFQSAPPPQWGIRSRKLRISESHYVTAESPRAMVSPAALTMLESDRTESVTAGRRVALKTWLGHRYDRPAVPDSLVDLARAIGTVVNEALIAGGEDGRIGDHVREVLMQIDDGASPPRVSLFAVLDDHTYRESVRKALAAAALNLQPTLGVIDEVGAHPSSEVSLALLETSYSADLSDITWRGADPMGAT